MALTTNGQAAAQRATLIRVQEEERRKKQDAAKLSAVKSTSRAGEKAAQEYVSALTEANKTRQVEAQTTRNARQEAIDRATRGSLLGEYTVERGSDGVTTITQTPQQKAMALSRILGTLNEKQQQVLDQAVQANADRVMQSAGGFVDDSLLAKYAKAIQEATDADGNVNLDINSKYTFNPYTDGVPDEQARRAFNSLSIADQLQLEIGSNGKPKTPSFGDADVDTTIYDRYQAALKKVEAEDKQREANAKYTEKQQTAQKKQAVEEQRDAAMRAEVENLYQQHRGEWDYDTTAASKSIAKRYEVPQSDVTSIFEDLKTRYDYDDAAYQRAFRYKNLTDPTQIAQAAGVSDAALKQTERGVYTPTQAAQERAAAREQAAREAERKAERKAAFAAQPFDAGIDNEQPWEYENGKAYEAYWAAVDAGDMQAAKAELDGLRDRQSAQMQQLGADARYVVNQAVQGIGDVVSGTARAAAKALNLILPMDPADYVKIKDEGGNPNALEDRRKYSEALDTLLYISETSGSGPLNEYNSVGADQASETARFLGGLFRSGIASMTSGIEGAALGYALPGLEKTLSLSRLTKNAPRAVQVISKAVPDVTVGISSMPFMVQCWGSGYYTAKSEGYDENAAEVWGLYSAFAEGLPEAVSWNISATAGSSIKSKIYGGVSETAAKSSAKNGVKRILDNYGAQKTLNVIMTIAKAANSEGMEEIASNYLEYAGRKWILQQDAALPTAQENLNSYASGALLSLMGQGFSYATTSKAHKQAKQMLDDAANGNPPSAPQVQELIDACNEEAIKTPLSNAELDRMDAQGLKVDEGVVAKYRAANDALSAAEQRIANGLQQLSQMNAQGVSPAEPARKQLVDAVVKARAELAGLRAKRDAAHARYVQALDGVAATTEQAMEQIAQQRAQSDAEFGQWQVEELLKTDPRAVADAAAEMEAMCAQEIERLRRQLFVDGGRMDARVRENMLARVKQMQESITRMAELRTTANTQFEVRMRQDPEGTFDALVAAEEAARAAGQTERVQQIQQLEQQVLDYAASDKRSEIEGIPRQIELLQNAKKGVKSKRKLADLDAQINALQAQYDAYFTPTGMTEPMEAPRREARTNEDNAQPTAEPLTIPDETQNGETGTNTPPEVEASVQGEKTATEAIPAQQLIDQYRAYGATDEQIAQMARGLLDDADSEPSDIELAKEILDRLGQGNRSIAQRYIEANGSRARDSRVTDLLNIARQEASNGNAQAADEAGLDAAREILRGTAQPADPSIAAMKEQLRRLGVVPTAEERANIAATYGSYDAYRRAVAGVVPLGGQNKAGQSIDQAIGELADSFPRQVTGDDRVQWLYDFARNNPAGAIAYDGDLDADARSLWDQIRSENADYFAPAAQQNPGFDVPDFTQPNVKYGKAAASDWLRNTLNAGTEEATVLDYARDKSVTALTGKERAFWDNVQQAAQNEKPTRQAFKPTQDEQLLRDTIYLFDGTSPYTQDGLEMQRERSTARAPRKLTAIKRDIQHIVGFTYSDEHYNGALRRSGAVAYYEPAHNFVSSSDTNNITAFLHEVGHAVGLAGYDADEVDAFLHTMPQAFINQYDPAVRAEEAGAEMFRAWMLNPDSMERMYPNTFAGVRQAMGARKYERLKEQGNAVRYFLGDSTEGRINATMYERKDAPKPPARDVLRRTTDALADKWYGFKKMDRSIARARGEEVRNGLDAKMAQARTSSEAVNALFFDGVYDPNTGRRVGSSLAETMQGIRSREDIDTLNAYLEVMQALDRYEENPDDWVFSRDVCTPAEARAYAEQVERTKPNVVESANNLWAWLKTYRDTQLSSAISADAKAEWENRNPHYIPQTRNFTLEIHGNGQRGDANGQGTGVNRRRVGSTRDIVTPVEAIAQMVTRTKTAAMQHEVLATLQDYYDNDPDGVAGTFLHEIPPEMVPTTVPEDVIRRTATEALRDAGMDDNTVESVDNTLRTALQPTRVFTVRQPNGRGGNAIAITVDGRTRYFEVYDQDLLDALTAAPPQQVKGALGVVKKVSRVINSLITSKNPVFALGNAARDFQEAYFTGSEQNPVKFVRDYVMAAADVIRNSDVARQYKAMGGSGGMSTLYADDVTINDLKKAMFGSAGDSRNAMQKALGVVNDAIENINGGIETIPRLAEYKRQLRRGASYADAIKAAKNCTTDFSTTGSGSGGDMSIWRFYNASVQSTYKMANMVIDGMNTPEGRRRLGKQVGAMLAFGVAGRALAELLLQINDDGTYEAMPEYIKDSYWVIPTGKKGKYVRIPLPNGALMTTVNALGRRIGMTAMGIKDGDGVLDTLGEQAQGLLFDMLNGLIPFGDFNEGNPLGSNFVLNPAIQVFSNTSWTGAPIVPASMENLSPALQYTDSTSALAKYIGKVLNVSPLKVDYIINQNSGVIGEVKDAVQTGVNKAQTDGAAAGVGAGLKEFFLSRFLVDTAYSEQVTSAYYDQRELLSTFISDVDETMDRDGLPYSPQLKGLNPQQTQAAYAQAKALDKQLGALTKQLSALSQMATRAANDGDEEKAREYRFKRQELAAEGSLHIAEFYDRWKQVK